MNIAVIADNALCAELAKIEGIKIGQLWLVDKGAFDLYIEQAQDATDQRFGPK